MGWIVPPLPMEVDVPLNRQTKPLVILLKLVLYIYIYIYIYISAPQKLKNKFESSKPKIPKFHFLKWMLASKNEYY